MLLNKLNQKISSSGYKKKWLGKELGITPSSLTYKLQGKRDFKVEEFAKLCDILNCQIDEFIEIKNDE